jgi:hypothetical protein
MDLTAGPALDMQIMHPVAEFNNGKPISSDTGNLGSEKSKIRK